jgi:hypothetical protein
MALTSTERKTMRIAAGLIVSCLLVGPLVQAQVPEVPAKRLQVGQVPAARPADAPAVQNDTSGDVDKTGDENNGAQRGPAVLGQQPSPPLPVLTTPSNLEDPSQAGDTTETKRTLGRACDSGESRGCYTLGVLEHKSGNLAEAKRLFAKACEGGDMGGCNNLGLLEKQAGNLAMAKRLYARACIGNDMRACTNLGALEKQAGNLAEARRLFVQACNGGEALACDSSPRNPEAQTPVYTPAYTRGLLVMPYVGFATPVGSVSERYYTGLRLGILAGWHISRSLSLSVEITRDFVNRAYDRVTEGYVENIAWDFSFSPLFHLPLGFGTLELAVGPKLGFFKASDEYLVSFGEAFSGSDSYNGLMFGTNIGVIVGIGFIAIGALFSYTSRYYSSWCHDVADNSCLTMSSQSSGMFQTLSLNGVILF